MVSNDKKSCVVIMNKSDYQKKKMQQMINDDIRDSIYKGTVDNTLDELKTF